MQKNISVVHMRVKHLVLASGYACGASCAIHPDMELSNAIRQIRREQRMTQQQVARAADMEQATLSRIESGKQTISCDQLFALARALRVRASVIVQRAEGHDPKLERWSALYERLAPEQREAALQLMEPRAHYGPEHQSPPTPTKR
jgi:transcriptional regulator with XRE-family HTH domain